VVIPAYNESARLPETLRRSVVHLDTLPWRSRIVVVDNGSVDETAALAHTAAARTDRVDVTVIGCSRPGKGAAVRRGLLTSDAPLVGFYDADLATPLSNLATAVVALRAGASAAIASRHVPGSRFTVPQTLGRRAGGTAFRMLSRSLVPGIADTQCGFKFFRRDAVRTAIARVRTTGFAFDVELLAQVQRDGGRIVEIPVDWTDGAGSTFHPLRDGVASFRAVLNLHGSVL
jgi:glycosyltransferase involved in cell wall biosynthesis